MYLVKFVLITFYLFFIPSTAQLYVRPNTIFYNAELTNYSPEYSQDSVSQKLAYRNLNIVKGTVVSGFDNSIFEFESDFEPRSDQLRETEVGIILAKTIQLKQIISRQKIIKVSRTVDTIIICTSTHIIASRNAFNVKTVSASTYSLQWIKPKHYQIVKFYRYLENNFCSNDATKKTNNLKTHFRIRPPPLIFS